eukprot:gene8782-33651_t
MANPWEGVIDACGRPDLMLDGRTPLLVELLTDCNSPDTWYEAKPELVVDGRTPLLVELLTDCNSPDTWYEAK